MHLSTPVLAAPLNPHRPYPISTTSSKNDGVLIAVFFGLIYPLIVAAVVIGYLCLRKKGGDARPHARDMERGEMTEAEKQGTRSCHHSPRAARQTCPSVPLSSFYDLRHLSC